MQPFSPTGAVIDLTGGFSKLSFVLGFFLVVSGIVALFFLKIFQTNSKTKDI